jgi:anti-sigma factor RsiW
VNAAEVPRLTARGGTRVSCDSEALSAYHDQELDAVGRHKIEQHLAECAACQEELAQLVALDTELGTQLPWEPPEAAIARAVMVSREAVASRERPAGWLRRLFTARVAVPVPALALAAALLAAVAWRAGAPAFWALNDGAAGRGRPGHSGASLAVWEEWPDRGALWETPQAPVTPVAGHPVGRQGSTHIIYQEFSIGI